MAKHAEEMEYADVGALSKELGDLKKKYALLERENAHLKVDLELIHKFYQQFVAADRREYQTYITEATTKLQEHSAAWGGASWKDFAWG